MSTAVDPARDTVAQVKEYCKDFHPRLLGLTGTPVRLSKERRHIINDVYIENDT